MKVVPLPLEGAFVLEPEIFEDERGAFFESFSQREFERLTGAKLVFVQDNHSVSRQGVLRGMHYQVPPCAQGKLVRVISGEAFDVIVDIRKSSATFGRWAGEHLSAGNCKQIWVPEGFAHGFLALSEQVEVIYKASAYYSREHERCIAWDDRELAIEWPMRRAPVLSPKDAQGSLVHEAELFD